MGNTVGMHWSAFCLFHWWQKNFEDAHEYRLLRASCLMIAGLPRAKRAWDRAPYSWNMVNLFSFGCHVIDRAYVRTYVRVYRLYGWGRGDYQRKGGVSQACLGKSTSLI